MNEFILIMSRSQTSQTVLGQYLPVTDIANEHLNTCASLAQPFYLVIVASQCILVCRLHLFLVIISGEFQNLEEIS